MYDHVFITFYIITESTRHVVKYGRVLYLCISFHYNPYDMLFVPAPLRNAAGFSVLANFGRFKAFFRSGWYNGPSVGQNVLKLKIRQK